MSMNEMVESTDLFRYRELSPCVGDVPDTPASSPSPASISRLPMADPPPSSSIPVTVYQQRSVENVSGGTATADCSVASELDDIAQQIADHAETLYKTWRARGLSPGELLRSHNTTVLNNEAAQTLSRQLRAKSVAATSSSLQRQSRSPSEQGASAVLSSNCQDEDRERRSTSLASLHRPTTSNGFSEAGFCRPTLLRSSSADPYSSVKVPARVQSPRKEHTIPIKVEHGYVCNSPDLDSQPRESYIAPPAPVVHHSRNNYQTNSSAQLNKSMTPIDLLCSPNESKSLEAMVNSFVKEDRARLSASPNRISPSSSKHIASPRVDSGPHPMLPDIGVSDHSLSDSSGQMSRLQVSSQGDAKMIVGDVVSKSHTSNIQDFPQEIDNVFRGALLSPRRSSSFSALVDPDSLISPPKLFENNNNTHYALQSSQIVGAMNQYQQAIGRSRSCSPSSGDPSVASSVSTVDYVKKKLQDPHSQSRVAQRLEDSRAFSQPSATAGASVQHARSRYDHGQINISDAEWRTDWLSTAASDRADNHQSTTKYHPTSDHNAAVVSSTASLGDSSWRKKRVALFKSASSPSTDLPSSPVFPSSSAVAAVTGSSEQVRTASPLPHPELTAEQRQHIRQRNLSPTPYNAAGVPIRPFLTQGSVAERVLIFERCPAELKHRAQQQQQQSAEAPSSSSGDGRDSWRATDIKDKTETYERDKSRVIGDSLPGSSKSPLSSSSSTSCVTSSPRPVGRRSARDHVLHHIVADPRQLAASSKQHPHQAVIPRFYYPQGRPEECGELQLQARLADIARAFSKLSGAVAHKQHFDLVAQACGVPKYWKVPLFLAAGGDKQGHVTSDMFVDFWKCLSATCHDDECRFMHVLTCGQRRQLRPEDLVPLVQDVVETHPGLTFLRDAAEFHSRYIHTVIARIFYCINRSWSGRISLTELRRSNLLSTILLLQNQDDINQITDYFSYEHFYVIYCKFWELDTDHDLLIDKNDLAKHNDHAVSSRIISRIFSGAVTRRNAGSASGGASLALDKMSYTEFVWFLLSEEDKRHPTAIEYWFRCMDVDGDGVLSMYELEYFYDEQLQRLHALGIDALPFKDCLCWMLDMVQPEREGRITLGDLKRCQMTNVFFDTFFNLEKYLEHDQRDPFSTHRDGDSAGQMSDWERYAAEEYELLVAEEGATEQDPELSLVVDV